MSELHAFRGPARLAAPMTALALLLVGSASGPAMAGLAQDDVSSPGGFVSAYAGQLDSSRPNAGSDYGAAYLPGLSVVDETLFSGATAATRAASFDLSPYVNSATGTVSMGALTYQAQADETFHLQISGATMNGGWTDTLVFTSPGLEGQNGSFTFELAFSGLLMAGNGPAGLALLDVEAYRNQNLVSSNISWQVQSTQINPSASRAIAESRTLTLPFVFGQPFDLGVYAAARAGTSSSGNLPVSPTAALQVAMNWAGVVAVADAGGQMLGSYTLASASGVDWTQAVSPVPGPASAVMLGVGLACLGGYLRATRRAS